MKLRKIELIFISLLMILLCVFSGCGLTIVNENKYEDAIKIAKEEFDAEEILIVNSSSTNNDLIPTHFKKYVIWVLGIKDNENILIAVPADKNKESYQVEWKFTKSFEEMIEKLNSSEEGVVCLKEEYYRLELFSDKYLIEDMLSKSGLKYSNFIDIVIEYKNYSIVQIDEKIVVLKTEGNHENYDSVKILNTK